MTKTTAAINSDNNNDNSSKNAEQETEKLAHISEIMEGLEDTHKDKDWLLQQIKQNQIKIPLESNTTVVGILKACPADFISHILDTMSLKELEDFEVPSPI
jgi:hypothetical protein